jgi:hypothetical protein
MIWNKDISEREDAKDYRYHGITCGFGSAEFEIVSDQSKVSHAARKRQNTQSTRYTVAPLSLAWFGVLKEKTVVYILRYFLLFADASTC